MPGKAALKYNYLQSKQQPIHRIQHSTGKDKKKKKEREGRAICLKVNQGKSKYKLRFILRPWLHQNRAGEEKAQSNRRESVMGRWGR